MVAWWVVSMASAAPQPGAGPGWTLEVVRPGLGIRLRPRRQVQLDVLVRPRLRWDTSTSQFASDDMVEEDTPSRTSTVGVTFEGRARIGFGPTPTRGGWAFGANGSTTRYRTRRVVDEKAGAEDVIITTETGAAAWTGPSAQVRITDQWFVGSDVEAVQLAWSWRRLGVDLDDDGNDVWNGTRRSSLGFLTGVHLWVAWVP